MAAEKDSSIVSLSFVALVVIIGSVFLAYRYTFPLLSRVGTTPIARLTLADIFLAATYSFALLAICMFIWFLAKAIWSEAETWSELPTNKKTGNVITGVLLLVSAAGVWYLLIR